MNSSNETEGTSSQKEFTSVKMLNNNNSNNGNIPAVKFTTLPPNSLESNVITNQVMNTPKNVEELTLIQSNPSHSAFRVLAPINYHTNETKPRTTPENLHPEVKHDDADLSRKDFGENIMEDELKSSKKKKCNCKNSKCLKLYCECFAARTYCDNCNCVGCCNFAENEELVKKAVSATLERNAKAFRTKICYSPVGAPGLAQDEQLLGKHNKGCNCKKSNCLKKYCECFQAGILCSENCKCTDCKNFEGNSERKLFTGNREASYSPPLKRIKNDKDAEVVYFTPIQPHRPASNPILKSNLRRPIPQYPIDKNSISPEICKVLLDAAKEVEDDKDPSKLHRKNSASEPFRSLANILPSPNFRPSSAPAYEPPKQERAVLEELATFMKKTVQIGDSSKLQLAPLSSLGNNSNNNNNNNNIDSNNNVYRYQRPSSTPAIPSNFSFSTPPTVRSPVVVRPFSSLAPQVSPIQSYSLSPIGGSDLYRNAPIINNNINNSNSTHIPTPLPQTPPSNSNNNNNSIHNIINDTNNEQDTQFNNSINALRKGDGGHFSVREDSPISPISIGGSAFKKYTGAQIPKSN